MSYTRLMGLNVIDSRKYQAYREHMLPILNSYGGDFTLDVEVSNVLKSPTDKPINRLFSITFPSEDTQTAFFADQEYIAIKHHYFSSAVSDVSLLSSW